MDRLVLVDFTTLARFQDIRDRWSALPAHSWLHRGWGISGWRFCGVASVDERWPRGHSVLVQQVLAADRPQTPAAKVTSEEQVALGSNALTDIHAG